MSTLVTRARPMRDINLRPLPWQRMLWVIWRQHRAALGGLAISLGVLALGLWIVGLELHHAYSAASNCRPVSSGFCANLASRFADTDHILANGYLLQAVPALIGAFLGAPVLAREFETGTFRYAWTQGFGPTRWTLAKVAVLAIIVTAAAGAFSLLLDWYYAPYFATGNYNLAFYDQSPLAPGLFDLRGIVFAAWTLAAFAIGCLAGTLIRRVVPAIAVTLAVYIVLALITGMALRPNYMTAVRSDRIALLEGPRTEPLGTKWILGQSYTKAGHAVSEDVVNRALRGIEDSEEKGFDATLYLRQHGYTLRTSYQPSSRFWSFQWIEAGWLLALSLVLSAITMWLVRRRIA